MSDGPPPQQPDAAAPAVSQETASPRREAEAKGAVPTPPPPETRQPQPTPPARASPPIQQPSQQRPQGFLARLKTSGNSIKQQLQWVMFSGSGDTPVPLSGDIGKFCIVMSVFHNYERSGKPEIGLVRDALQKINKSVGSIFYEDFPFYLILAYRLHLQMGTYYHYSISQHFIMTCINMMEIGSHRDISTTLYKFLRASDFTIMFDHSKANTSVFLLLELACIQLCKISFATRQGHHVQKKPPPNELYERFIYNTMVWVSLSLKVRSHRGAVTRSTPKPWKDHLTSRSHLITLNQVQIDGLKIGLKFGRAIELPPELKFNAELMCDMLVPRDPSTITVRYFTHLSYFFKELHTHLSSTDTVVIVNYLRGMYDQCLGPGYSIKYSHFSPSGTLTGTLTEGLEFLNQVSSGWTRRKVADSDLSAQIKAELWKWLELLLGLIDITRDQAHTHLKQFMRGKGVVKDFQKEIKSTVVATTKKNFPQLSIQQFFPLFIALLIWPPTFLEDYLRQYKVSGDVKISDATWTEFFRGISERISGAHAHHFINDFLQQVAVRYQESNRAKDFVLDLLKLHVPTLLVIQHGEGEEIAKEGEKVQREFKQFLHSFIQRNALKQSLLKEMIVIMDSITAERDEFQGLVLDVLKKEVVLEFKVLRGEESLSNAAITSIIKKSVTDLCRNLEWLTVISPKQSFCWGIVASCCSKVPVRKENLEWVQDYDYLINYLCHVYKSFCTGQEMRAEEDRRLKELPKKVLHNEDIKTYFKWVQQVQTVVLAWRERVRGRELNYDEIMVYANIQGGIQSIGDAISASSSILEPHILQQHKNTYLQYFEHLNVMLLRYIPGKPEVKWCTLSSLLAENGVSFPPELAESITKYVEIPGETKEVEGGLLENEMRCDTSGLFKPGQAVSLKLSKRLGLRDLIRLVSDLQVFLEPILDQMEMLVFFKLHKSDMFNKYQKLYLDKEVKKLERKLNPLMPSVTSTYGSFPSVSQQRTEPQEVKMSLPILVRSLDQTKELLIKLIEGNATYNEIIAEGQLDLENLDIDREFDILSGFILHLKHTLKSEVGLEGVRCMLELFQYQRHILKIRDVCDQYKLKGCLEDEELKSLVEIAEELGPEKSRQKVTLVEATSKMKQVRKLFFGKESERAKSHCLKLFYAVASNEAFYHFIKNNRAQGQEMFAQQYMLITTKLLQNKECDIHIEQILNHLFAAYKFMLPFMNIKQDFSSLMDQVVQLDTSNCLKQLRTVKSNFAVIKLWFSRAEEEIRRDLQSYDAGIADQEHLVKWVTGEPERNQSALAQPPQLSVGSRIELILQPTITGVVRSMTVGVELDVPMEGCSDGEYSGQRYFTCGQRRGFFCPISHITPSSHSPNVEGQSMQESQLQIKDNPRIIQRFRQEKEQLQIALQENQRQLEEEQQKLKVLQQRSSNLKLQLRQEQQSHQQEHDRCQILQVHLQEEQQNRQQVENQLGEESKRYQALQVHLQQQQKQSENLLQEEHKRCENLQARLQKEQQNWLQVESQLEERCQNLQISLEEEQQNRQQVEVQLEQEQKRCQGLEVRFQHEQQQSENMLHQEQERCRNLQTHLEQEQENRRQVEGQLHQEQEQSHGLQGSIQDLQEQLDRATVEIQSMQPDTNASFTRAERSNVQIDGQDPIGEGAWGKVESGMFRGSPVAVKSIHHAILAQSTIAKLKREITIMAQVHHPNLVRFVAAVLDGPAERLQAPAMILTELLDTNLRRAYEERRIIPAHYLGILRDVAYGLHHLHNLQTPIIHRDVSAPNVLLQQLPNGGWLAKVSDFGSANFAKLAKTLGEGAIIYTAPEAMPAAVASDASETEPEKLTTKVDVFSYGKVACELVVREMPVPERFRAMLREVERNWAFMHRLIVRCTRTKPLERPSMADILNELPCPGPGEIANFVMRLE